MSSASAPPSPWRSGRWVFGAVWLLFIVYPIIGVVTADTGPGVKALALALLAVSHPAFPVLLLVAVGGLIWQSRRRLRTYNLPA